MWQSAFVAVGITLGEPLDALLATLGDVESAVAPLAAALRSETREMRARALAAALAPLAAEIDRGELSWRG